MDARQRLGELQTAARQRKLTADEWREVSRLFSSLGQDAESRQAWAKADRAAARERIAALTVPGHEPTVAELYELAGLHRQLGDEAAAKLAEETATARRSEDVAAGRVEPDQDPRPTWSYMNRRDQLVFSFIIGASLIGLWLVSVRDNRERDAERATVSQTRSPSRTVADFPEVPSLRADLAAKGCGLDARVTPGGSLSVNLRSPILMSELEAKEIGLLAANRLTKGAPYHAYIHVWVYSPAGQQLCDSVMVRVE